MKRSFFTMNSAVLYVCVRGIKNHFFKRHFIEQFHLTRCGLLLALAIVFIFLSSSHLLAENDEWKKPVGPIIEDARGYYAAGDLDKTIESYRKVLFIDQFNSRASFALASALAEKGDIKKALKEYSYCVKMIKADESLTGVEKQELLRDAESRIAVLEGERKKNDPFTKSELSFYQMNVLVLSVLIVFFLLYESSTRLVLFVSRVREAREQNRIWLDRYWERRREREIKRFPVPVFSIIMHFILLFFVFQGFTIVKNHGLAACVDSFVLIWRSFFA